MMAGMKKVCVCFSQAPFVRGGAEIFRDNLVEQLKKRSFEVEIIQLPLQTQPLEEVLKGCLAWRFMNLDRIGDENLDLVIGTKFPSYLVPHSNKIIWLEHQHREVYDLYGTNYSGYQITSKDNQLRHHIFDLDQIAFSETRKIFSQSKTVAQRLKDYNGFDSTVVYPPLGDTERFHFTAMEDFVLSVTRLAANKRIHLLIEAMQYVSSRFRAVIVGEGFLRSQYEKLASDVGVSDRVIFTGGVSRDEVINFYARAGVVFYGPIGEDYGYSTLETFYSRKPVITCPDSGGVLEFVDESNGWIALCNPKSIAECIDAALINKEVSRGKGEAGYHRISYINWDYVLDSLLS